MKAKRFIEERSSRGLPLIDVYVKHASRLFVIESLGAPKKPWDEFGSGTLVLAKHDRRNWMALFLESGRDYIMTYVCLPDGGYLSPRLIGQSDYRMSAA